MGAQQGFIYVRAEYHIAIRRLKSAIGQAERHNLLGANIAESTFSFQVDIRVGAGAFVCGEETALIASVQGRRGTPRLRPPYPAVSGLWGQPTLINNVETFANVPPIIRNGGAWYAEFGTADSMGTKVFALAEVGSIMGPGGMIVMDQTSCMVDVAKYFVGFCRDESCGKCVPCRVGTVQLYRMPLRLELLAPDGAVLPMSTSSSAARE